MKIRFVNTITKRVRLVDDTCEPIPPYATLSHVWDSTEVLLEDLESLASLESKPGYSKLYEACLESYLKYGLEWLWIDTVCVDRLSSKEVADAIIHCMGWFQNCQVCLVYLDDVLGETSVAVPSRDIKHKKSEVTTEYSKEDMVQLLSHSRWMRRAWTLPELLAPKRLEFYNKSWQYIGSKSSLLPVLSNITGIDQLALQDARRVVEFSVATRMSWAAHRESHHAEDIAYSLLGIFGVNMTIDYGEGLQRAFHRLQEQILNITNDASCLAWKSTDNRQYRGLLADSPSDFAFWRDYVQRSPRSLQIWGSTEISDSEISISGVFGILNDTDGDIVIILSGQNEDGDIPMHFGILLSYWKGSFVRYAPEKLVELQDISKSTAGRICALRNVDPETSTLIAQEITANMDSQSIMISSTGIAGCKLNPLPEMPRYNPRSGLERPAISTSWRQSGRLSSLGILSGTSSPRRDNCISTQSRKPRILASYYAKSRSLDYTWSPALGSSCSDDSPKPSQESREEQDDDQDSSEEQDNGEDSTCSSQSILSGDVEQRATAINGLDTDVLLAQPDELHGYDDAPEPWLDKLIQGAAEFAMDIMSQWSFSSDCTTSPTLKRSSTDDSYSTLATRPVKRLRSSSWTSSSVAKDKHSPDRELEELPAAAKNSLPVEWMCPFFLLKPLKHHRCLSRSILKGIREVKRHISSKHRLPAYCPLCNEIFCSPTERDAHIRSLSCELQTPVDFDGVIESQIRQLALPLAQGTISEEGEWFRVWDIVSDRSPRPLTPWGQHSDLMLLICALRHHWRLRGEDVIASFLASKPVLDDGTLARSEATNSDDFRDAVLHRFLDNLASNLLQQDSHDMSTTGKTKDLVNILTDIGQVVKSVKHSSS
jgi:hypothetical protein